MAEVPKPVFQHVAPNIERDYRDRGYDFDGNGGIRPEMAEVGTQSQPETKGIVQGKTPDGMITVGGMDVPIFNGEAVVGTQGVIFDGQDRVSEIK